MEKEKEKKEKNPHYKSGYDEHLRTYDRYETSEKNRGRLEYRTMEVCENIQTITMAETISSIKTIGWLRQIRIPIEKDREGNDITPDLWTFLEKGSVRKPKITRGGLMMC